MQTIQQKVLSHKVNIANVPETYEEFDKAAGEAGAALREAIKNVVYRSWMAEFRNVFLHGREEEKDKDGNVTVAALPGLEELTGVKRLTKVTKPEERNAEGKITQEEVVAYDETEDKFESRVYAELVKRGDYGTVEAAVAAFASHAQTVASAIPFDPKKTERKSAGPKTTPKTYVEIAQDIVAATGSIEAAVAAFERKTGRTGTVVSVEALAKAVWEDQKAQRKQIASGYVAA
jgi:hypothetical protein